MVVNQLVGMFPAARFKQILITPSTTLACRSQRLGNARPSQGRGYPSVVSTAGSRAPSETLLTGFHSIQPRSNSSAALMDERT